MKEKIDFIGIGVPKCGTTWVTENLKEHPDILISEPKELNFFNDNFKLADKMIVSHFDKGINWYLKQFSQNNKIKGEFSVIYIFDKQAPFRIKKYFPHVKLIVVLRNPVDMIYSLHNWLNSAASSNVPFDFEKAIEEGYYLELGFYSKYLKRYYELFNKNNICVILFDDIKSNPCKVLRDLYSFLGVDKSYIPNGYDKKINVSQTHRFWFIKKMVYFTNLLFKNSLPRRAYFFIIENKLLYYLYCKVNIITKKYPKLEENTKTTLIDYYSKDIDLLEKLINRDLSSWKEESR